MYIFYSTEDQALSPQGNVHWYHAAHLVACSQQRNGMSERIRNIVRGFDDQEDEATKKTMIKHYVPYCRISRQLVYNITNSELEGSSAGMTREASVHYLQKILDGLQIDGKGFEGPLNEPWESRMAYDIWVSWAISTICDWPENLFQGVSYGDNRGTTIDTPVIERTSPALQMRLGDAAKALKYWIKGLSIEHETGDAPATAYEEYIPGEDEWFLP